ncbi:MAG: crossover junction endonuclease eme1, partial [Paramarteilia canceri]
LYDKKSRIVDGQEIFLDTNPGFQTKSVTSNSKNWLQFLETQKMLSPAVSRSISELYPNLNSLLEAYNSCATEKEAKELLANVEVKRGGGKLQTCKRIGEILSAKVYNFFHCVDPNGCLE